MASKRLTPKRIKEAISDVCQAACLGHSVNIMHLGDISDAAEKAYAEFKSGFGPKEDTHENRLKAARTAADEAVLKYAVKPKPLKVTAPAWKQFTPMAGDKERCEHCHMSQDYHVNGRCQDEDA